MFVPHTDAERAGMLAALGMTSIDQLFSAVPESVRFPELNLTESLSESEMMEMLTELDRANLAVGETPCFLGAGAWII